MSGALGAGELFELKLIFLRELAGGYASARAAYDGLGAAAGSDERPLDRAAVDVLRHLFHRLAGTASSVDLPLLGRLSAACESACDALLAGAGDRRRRRQALRAARYFKERLGQELLRARRHGNAPSLCAVDLDHFKRVNESYGSPAGDARPRRTCSPGWSARAMKQSTAGATGSASRQWIESLS